ncbi:hypothetical protein [Amycolatopsis sp. DSM 110486]|uniref:hypothetical protein n=1 Tax=Amycolatopsis sp. DSM 110486 TaxID=2865832 RepID=UPI001C69BE89|nr:hypothetical protein [Amycolatopsis sp. DSM 110486]QYN17608.1 hypothetical protein K1T34_33015 [Amycolatopsis sp. DSM 110486]
MTGARCSVALDVHTEWVQAKADAIRVDLEVDSPMPASRVAGLVREALSRSYALASVVSDVPVVAAGSVNGMPVAVGGATA